MHRTLRAGLRVVGLAVMAIAIAHCGDDDNNDNITGTPATRTPTPTVPSVTVTPTPEVSTSDTVTVTPTPVGAACPSAVSFEGDVNNAQLDPGWTGQSHGAGVIDKGKVTVSLQNCQSATRPCGQCDVSGPIPNPDAGNGTSNNRRCSGDTSIECTSDADCAAVTPATCKFFFGAPLALSAGGVSTCVINEVNGSITGTANVETGSAASVVNLISRVFTGPTADSPCPKCLNDPTPVDGQRGGTCSGGIRDGQSCDVGGTHGNQFFGSTSFDCPPQAPSAAIAALPIRLASSTGTVTRTLSADSPDCRGKDGAKCFCDTCNNINAEPCSVNADCPESGGAPGVCGGRRCRLGANAGNPCTVNTDCPGGACSVPGEPTTPNPCLSETCLPTAGNPNNGQCEEPFEQFCGPTATFIGCGQDSDCAEFPGNTCSVGKNRACFLDNGVIGGSVTAIGIADPPVGGVAHPTLASLFCIGPTSSGAVNAVAGIPGLGRLQLGGIATEIP